MHNFIFRGIANFRQNYWFWPSTLTFSAVILGFLLPYLDSQLGAEWIRAIGPIRPTEVDAARAILTTLASATLGVAGVAFSVTIVAVSFASSNYGPRLIGNFMGDRKNQIILGVFVATFVYCITVLSTVRGPSEPQADLDAFVPQISVFFALLLTLAAVCALIAYIHHIPESINIMNLTANIGDKLHRSVVLMMDEEERRGRDERDAVDVEAWHDEPNTETSEIVRAEAAGFIQRIDLGSLAALAREKGTQIVLHRAPGDFLVAGETFMSADRARNGDGTIAQQMRGCYTQGASRTDVQDVLFLSDQLVEVLGRALSPGVNDPHTAMLCLDWLRSGLVAFARRSPAQPAKSDDPVLYRRVTFEDMLDRSFDRMRQYVATDRTVTLHALGVLAYLARSASRQAMADACVHQMHRLATSAKERLDESVAHEEIDAELKRALRVSPPAGTTNSARYEG